MVEQLGDADYRRRDVAASSLRKIPEARAALIKELSACVDASKAWSIAELLPSFEGKWRQDTLDGLWQRLKDAIDDEERIQTAFLHVLKQADPAFAYRQLADGSFGHEGKLRDAGGNAISIDGLWALEFGNGSVAGPTDTLFFTAGPDEEEHGLFGKIEATG